MKDNCDIIKDLLPLYADNVCSDGSRAFVEEHLKSCDKCSEYLKEIKQTLVEDSLIAEGEGVISHQAKAFRKKSAVFGIVAASILALPIIICLIVNLASGHALDWFFIVLFSMTLTASLFVVPFLAPKNKLFFTFASFLASLTALLAACCVYSGGRWFFVAESATVFGLSLFLVPIAVHHAPLSSIVKNQKGLASMAVITVLFYAMLAFIGAYVQSYEYNALAYPLTIMPVGYAWAMFAILRYVKASKLSKAGICVILSSLFCFFIDYVTCAVIGPRIPLPKFHPFTWNYMTLDDNVTWLTLIGGIIIGAIFLAGGVLRKGKRR